MSMLPLRTACAAALVFLAIAPASAAPKDAQVGQVRVVFRQEGAVLRAEANALAAPVTTLASGTQVRVEEVKLPWLRVTAGAQTGWLRARETTEPETLAASAPPRPVGVAGPGVSAADVAAAGRQLDAATERGYRGQKPDLEAAYAQVDAIERATHARRPGDSIAFVTDGSIGRAGRRYALPGRLPPDPPMRENRGASDLAGRIGRGLGGLIGGEVGGRGGEVLGSALEEACKAFAQKLSQAFTPQQEYYLGRAVAANAIAKYRLDRDPARRAYVKAVGDALVRVNSRVPANFGGYHFDVLDSDEVNGISGPGGFVFLTRGAVEACATEDELASVLAHELAHVTQKHGERVLRQGREFQGMIGSVSRVAGTAAGGGQFAQQLVTFMDQAVGSMARTAMEHGYGKDLEFAADAEGTNLVFDAWYDHASLQAYLGRMATNPHRHAGASTHAPPEQRQAALQPLVSRWPAFPDAEVLAARKARFDGRRTFGAGAQAPASPFAPQGPPPAPPPGPGPGRNR
jgi:Zn-dependent protease with chaperone function